MRFPFPHYLFPSFLFRNSPPACDSDPPSRSKKRSRDEKIQAAGQASFSYLCCRGCHTPCILPKHDPVDVVTNSAIISKGFAGRYGRGYLCHDVINVDLGRVQERNLLTGLHTVRDLSCVVCKTSLGWKYCTAREPSQRYKMGKFLLEALNVVKLSHWPDPPTIVTQTESKSDEKVTTREYEESKWDTRSIDLETLTDEESRPSTPMRGKQVQGNMFYDDIEDLMLGWQDGSQRSRR